MNDAPTTRYWINTISLDHVNVGLEGGFTQADHGRNAKLKELSKGDLLVFYSSRTKYRDGEPLQMFTALGAIEDDEPYQVEMKPGFHPWRRKVKFLRSRKAAVRDLLDSLTFITDREKWGLPFRQGLFEVEHADFERIAQAMGVRQEAESLD